MRWREGAAFTAAFLHWLIRSKETVNILITGGADYIGAHAVFKLLQAGHRVTVLDNLHNGSVLALQRVEQTGGQVAPFVEGDIPVTAPGCGTTFMSWIWSKGTSPRWT